MSFLLVVYLARNKSTNGNLNEGCKMIRLKQLDSEYLETVMAFDKLNFPTDFWKAADWKDLMEDERALYYSFLDEENLVANAFIYNWKGEKDYIKIMNISVHQKYRGHGLACKLMKHVRDEMSVIGMKRFCGETRSSNKAMQTVFEKCGYHLDRIEEKYFQNPDESAYKYVLELK